MTTKEHKSLTSNQYMAKGIKYICKTFKNRTAGTKSERDSQLHFAKELEKWSDKVSIESFTLHPKAFLGWIIPAAILGIISVISFWLHDILPNSIIAIVGAISIFIAAIMSLLEFILYRRFVDILFPKFKSHNVYAVRQSKNQTKRRIIFGGHADAAYELTYSYKGRTKLMFSILIITAIGMIFILVTNIILLINIVQTGPVSKTGIWLFIGICDLLFVPIFIADLFFVNFKCVTDGANDNLSGCYVAMSILREMAQKEERFDNTEVCCFISGGEESGLRGALNFAKKHKHDFSDVETIFIALDTLREIEQLQVYTMGQNGLIKNCKEVGTLIHSAAKSLGHDLPAAKPYPGATDAEAFTRYGLKACALCACDHNPQPYYHTRRDTWTNIDEKCLDLCLNICNEAAKIYDKSNGLCDFKAKAIDNVNMNYALESKSSI